MAPATFLRSHSILVAEKYASMGSPVRPLKNSDSQRFLSSSHLSVVLLHCQTIALWVGLPVTLSHITVVSRWFVIPMAAIEPRGTSFRTFRTTPSTLLQISSGSCSTHPGLGKYWGNYW